MCIMLLASFVVCLTLARGCYWLTFMNVVLKHPNGSVTSTKQQYHRLLPVSLAENVLRRAQVKWYKGWKVMMMIVSRWSTYRQWGAAGRRRRGGRRGTGAAPATTAPRRPRTRPVAIHIHVNTSRININIRPLSSGATTPWNLLSTL